MLLMVEKGTRGGICHSLYWYTKANDKYKIDYDKKRIVIFSILVLNNLHGYAMSQKLPVKTYKWFKYISKFEENFIRSCNKKVINLLDKTEYVIHTQNLKQALDHELFF